MTLKVDQSLAIAQFSRPHTK